MNAANNQLYDRAEITQASGANIANDAQVGLVKLFLHSLFSDVNVLLNEMSVIREEIRPSVFSAHNKAMESGNAKYLFIYLITS